MNPEFRKVALIAAGLGLLVSLFFALRPNDDDETAATTDVATTTETAPGTTETPPATTAEPPATTTAPDTVQLDYVVVAGKPQGGIARDSVDRGQTVAITVTSDVADEVHVHGYDLMADVAPGNPVRIEFTATLTGRFEIELEGRNKQIAQLTVLP
jgi:hypothetical protein